MSFWDLRSSLDFAISSLFALPWNGCSNQEDQYFAVVYLSLSYFLVLKHSVSKESFQLATSATKKLCILIKIQNKTIGLETTPVPNLLRQMKFILQSQYLRLRIFLLIHPTSQSLSPASIIGTFGCCNFFILSILLLLQRTNLVVCCTKRKA